MKKTTKRIIKRIIGWAILLHIVPSILIVLYIIKGKVDEVGYLTLYIAGFITDVVFALFAGTFFLLLWCFNDD